MTPVEELAHVYLSCTNGIDYPDCILFAGYEEYVANCQRLGLKPLPESELMELVTTP